MTRSVGRLSQAGGTPRGRGSGPAGPPGPSFRATDVPVRRRGRVWPYVVAGVLAVAGPLLAELHMLAGFVGLAELLLLFFLPAILYDDSFRGLRRVGLVQADHDGLTIGKALVLPRARIDACAVEPLPEGMANVQLWGPGARDDVTLVLPEDRAKAFIEALGLRHDRHAARFLVESAPLRSPGVTRLLKLLTFLGASTVVAGVILGTVHAVWVGFTLVPLLFAYYGLVRRLRRRRAITLGADALIVKKTIPISNIRAVTAGAGAEAIVQYGTTSKEAPALRLAFDGRDAKDKRDVFVTRLQKSLAERSEVPAAAMLEPRSRERRVWLDDLRRLGGDGYRSGGVPTEELWRLVEETAATPGARIGALALLAPRLDAEGRVRLAEIAEATVGPDIRTALETAAEPGATDEAILEAYPEDDVANDQER